MLDFTWSSIPQFVWIAIAGGGGALCRWGISRAGYALLGAGFAWGTLIANIIGCFLLKVNNC